MDVSFLHDSIITHKFQRTCAYKFCFITNESFVTIRIFSIIFHIHSLFLDSCRTKGITSHRHQSVFLYATSHCHYCQHITRHGQSELAKNSCRSTCFYWSNTCQQEPGQETRLTSSITVPSDCFYKKDNAQSLFVIEKNKYFLLTLHFDE